MSAGSPGQQLPIDLPAQALGLLLSLIRSHAKGQQGAAKGLQSITSMKASITRLLMHAPVDDVVHFCQGALDPWGQGVHAGVADALWECLAGALARGVAGKDVAHQGASLTALGQLCAVVAPQVRNIV